MPMQMPAHPAYPPAYPPQQYMYGAPHPPPPQAMYAYPPQPYPYAQPPPTRPFTARGPRQRRKLPRRAKKRGVSAARGRPNSALSSGDTKRSVRYNPAPKSKFLISDLHEYVMAELPKENRTGTTKEAMKRSGVGFNSNSFRDRHVRKRIPKKPPKNLDYLIELAKPKKSKIQEKFTDPGPEEYPLYDAGGTFGASTPKNLEILEALAKPLRVNKRFEAPLISMKSEPMVTSYDLPEPKNKEWINANAVQLPRYSTTKYLLRVPKSPEYKSAKDFPRVKNIKKLRMLMSHRSTVEADKM